MSGIDILKALDERGALLFDSAMGTALMAAGQPAGQSSEEMNIAAPETVFRVHAQNIAAGCDAVTSNTFGVSAMILRDGADAGAEVLRAGVEIAKRAAGGGSGDKGVAVALGLGPMGCLLGEFGDVSYEEAEEAFAVQVTEGVRAGADFVLFETFSDIAEFTRAARAAKRVCSLPVFGTMSFGASGRSFMGAAPVDFVRAATEAGADAVGANCSLDPDGMAPIIREIVAAAGDRPVIAQPNAGMPVYENGRNEYRMDTDVFAAGSKRLLELGVRVIGGCCGTTPEMIAALRAVMDTKRDLL